MTTTMHNRRELAHRVTDGIEVSLFWDKVGDTLTLEVYDAKADDFFALEIRRDRALDAFHHPYTYLAAAEAHHLDEMLAA